MIFGDCVATGHPQFMRVSRVLYNDGQAVLFKQAIYRMRLGSAVDNNGHHIRSGESASFVSQCQPPPTISWRIRIPIIFSWAMRRPFSDQFL